MFRFCCRDSWRFPISSENGHFFYFLGRKYLSKFGLLPGRLANLLLLPLFPRSLPETAFHQLCPSEDGLGCFCFPTQLSWLFGNSRISSSYRNILWALCRWAAWTASEGRYGTCNIRKANETFAWILWKNRSVSGILPRGWIFIYLITSSS